MVITPLATTESVPRAPSTSISGTSPPKNPASSPSSTSWSSIGPKIPSAPSKSGTSQKGSSRKCRRAGTKRRIISRGLRTTPAITSRQPGRPLLTRPIRALHLGQAGGGALEGEGALALGEEGIRRRIGREIELHPRLVEGIDQGDQALCRIMLGRRQARHVVEEEHLELLRQRQVIGRPIGLFAEQAEGGAPYLLGGKGDGDAPPMDRDR